MRAAKAFAQSARTDLEKRNRLRNYYNIYYERMTALAAGPEIKLALQAIEDVSSGSVKSAKGAASTDGDSRHKTHARG